MKKLNLIALATLMTSAAMSQNTFPTTAGANAGWGITSPTFHFQIHGTTDYTKTIINPFPSPPTTANFGPTSRFGLTNSTTGTASTDGTLIRMSGLDFDLENQEGKKANFSSAAARISLNGDHNRIYMGVPDVWAVGTTQFLERGYITLQSTDNAMYLKSTASGKYGLAIKVYTNTDDAIRTFGATDGTKTFSVKGSGITEVNINGAGATETVFLVKNATRKLFQVGNDGILRSREIIVDLLNTWPDYVFNADYKLMPLEAVSGYIQQEGHLPNVPSASTVAAEGINVAEMNRILMEKVEELTLYLIQQDQRIKELEKASGK